MAHLRSFRAPRYRGLGGLSLEGLRRVNLVTGGNDSGKTSTLEAIWLFYGRYAPENLWDERVQRSAPPPPNPLSALGPERIEMRGVEDGDESSSSFEACFRPTGASGVDGRRGGIRFPKDGLPARFPRGAIPVHLRPARIDGSLRWWLDGEEVTGHAYPYHPIPGATNAVAYLRRLKTGAGGPPPSSRFLLRPGSPLPSRSVSSPESSRVAEGGNCAIVFGPCYPSFATWNS